MSHPDALRMAFQAYYNYKAAHPSEVRNPYFYFVDYGLGKGTPRGYVFDMDHKKLVEGPFTVAAGRGSGENSKGVPVRFSNSSGSGTSCSTTPPVELNQTRCQAVAFMIAGGSPTTSRAISSSRST